MSEVFVSTDARCACYRGVIASRMGTYPRRTGSNPVEGMGPFFPHAVSSIFRLSLTHPEVQVRIPSRAMGTFFPHTVSSIFRLSLTRVAPTQRRVLADA